MKIFFIFLSPLLIDFFTLKFKLLKSKSFNQPYITCETRNNKKKKKSYDSCCHVLGNHYGMELINTTNGEMRNIRRILLNKFSLNVD